MTIDAESIVRQAKGAGVRLQLTERGTVKAFGENDTLQRWTPILRERRDEIRQVLQGEFSKGRQESQRPPSPPNGGSVADFGVSGQVDRLKGVAVLFVAEGEAGDLRCWICADQADVDQLRRSGIEPGDVIIDRAEVRALVAVNDRAVVAEILRLKRELPDGRFHSEVGKH